MNERVLVSEGRAYADGKPMAIYLDASFASRGSRSDPRSESSRGRTADAWVKPRAVPVRTCPAEWKAHGRSAGPIGDTMILVNHRPTVFLAFPGGRRTTNMVRKARENRVPVIDEATLRAAMLGQTDWEGFTPMTVRRVLDRIDLVGRSRRDGA